MKKSVTVKNRKRIALGFVLLSLLLVGLTFRVGWHQVVNAGELTEKAIEQQTRDVPIAAKRGTIYDRNGKELASSITCYSIWVRPAQLTGGKTEAEIEKIANDLAETTGEEKAEIKEKIVKQQALVKIAKYLDKKTADKVRDLKLEGVQISEDTRRYYSLGNFASQVLGSVTDDNTGRTGIELEYDQYLSGVSGRWVRNIDVNGNELLDGSEAYHEAQDGLNVVLTIDEAIQYYVEKALEEGMKKTKAERIMCLVMDPKTGEILASAATPGFDPNNATQPTTKKALEEFKKLSTEKQNEYLFKLWRNPIVSDTYEPGSTFKLITVSSALEDKVISLTDTFSCNTSVNIAGTTLHCWSSKDHGTQTVKQAVGNSCNPAHAKIATKMGKNVFYKYLDLYGITSKTGVDYPGETSSITYAIENVGPVELATMGYGQSISVTPIQLLTAVNAIGNGGDLLEPHYVKALTDADGNVVKEYGTTVVRKVLSAKTAREVRDMMEYVVSDGGGGTAKVSGYRIGGKTGTANKIDAGSGKYGKDYYSSFLGMAPMDDPKVSILVVVDSPKGAFYGSLTAAPIAKSILTDTLRYLNVEPEYTKEEQAAIDGNYTTVPNVVGKEFSEAVGMISGKSLKYSRPKNAQDDDSFIVVDQYPKAGTKVKQNSVVYVYKE
ncbi:MAG: PASTA domain-containing protein [Firmicutes bacterium]|nr:PASTA domain-containing protein [Bacillota bacterium]